MKTYLLVVAVLCLSVSSAFAVSIPLLNGSFESPNISPNEAQIKAPTDWVNYSGGDTNSLIVRGHGLSGWGVSDPQDGDQWVALTAGNRLDQDTGVQWQLGHSYRLTAYLARGAGSGAINATIGLTMNMAQEIFVSPTFVLSDLPLGQWVQVVLDTGPVPQTWTGVLGKNIGVRLYEGSNWSYFDNVSLEDVTPPVPEPNALLALGSGLIGLAGFAIRRRK